MSRGSMKPGSSVSEPVARMGAGGGARTEPGSGGWSVPHYSRRGKEPMGQNLALLLREINVSVLGHQDHQGRCATEPRAPERSGGRADALGRGRRINDQDPDPVTVIAVATGQGDKRRGARAQWTRRNDLQAGRSEALVR
ncbi:hypothetical protein AAFF_G00130880 [Aldrovandia affinis]|uniref:Uncharacterized protein n=1 Tax=Aldrovandia affinis TaxID=143900 RepID=A0AAD7WAB5_9TELE|nr:hypothetical protein AAFF_G00130880 [Aldrovandia affinis]